MLMQVFDKLCKIRTTGTAGGVTNDGNGDSYTAVTIGKY